MALEPHETAHLWFEEYLTPSFRIATKLKRLDAEFKSEFQRVQMIETADFGKTLLIDSKTQSALHDEHIYHETLVHAAMIAHPNPKKIYIGGGGEMATAREVLRHNSVEKCVMVDIDKEVVEVCEKFMPEWNKGVRDDKRMEIYYDDAKAFLERSEDTFDVIIMDICDPIEAGPGIALYTKEFYEFALTKLSPGGTLVTQSGPCSLFNVNDCFCVIHKTLASVFGPQNVYGYSVNIPSFGSDWGFNLAVKTTDSRTDWANVEPAKIDESLEKRIKGGVTTMRHYDGVTHRCMFSQTLDIRKAIAKEERIITKDNPVYMF